MSLTWVPEQKALHNWVVSCTGLAADHVIWAQQQAPRPTQPTIVMKLMFVGDDGMPWVDYEPNPLVFSDIIITSVDAVANTFTKSAHGLLTGDGPVWIDSSTDDVPLNLAESTDYWVIKIDANTFKLATGYVNSMNGVAIDLGDVGTGTLTLSDRPTTLRSGQEIKFLSRSLLKCVLTLECYTGVGTGTDMASSILWRVNAKRKLPTQAAILDDAKVSVIEFGRVRAIEGTQDLVLFEPRASVDIMLHMISEEQEIGQSIERTVISNEDGSNTFTVDVEG